MTERDPRNLYDPLEALRKLLPDLPAADEGLYILDDQGQPQPEHDLVRWGLWMEQNRHNRHVGSDLDEGDDTGERVYVSTIFLGINHRFGDGPPLLFETMVFGGALDLEGRRYSTREEAARGHQEMCARVMAALRPPPADAT